MLEAAREAVRHTIKAKQVGVAFSGGVDSTLLAKMCHDMEYDVTLLTIGFAKSHDIESAALVNEHLRYTHHIHEIDPGSFSNIADRIKKSIPSKSLSWIENGIAFYYIAQLAKSKGIGMVAAANGIDELFCGYDAYRREYHMGEIHLLEMMDKKVQNELDMMDAIRKISLGLQVDLVQPFLSADFIRHARGIPVREKITGPEDLYRKHPIRRLAKEMGVPEISYARRKKALQYGSQIHQMLKTLP
ncbi:MAG: asparagine synthase [Nitrosopumilus sp. B06]|nr:MAG: asparagine synthase [Nitrosopumilus sp. B06]